MASYKTKSDSDFAAGVPNKIISRGTTANNSPVGAAGQPNNAAMKKAIASRLSRNNQRKKGNL